MLKICCENVRKTVPLVHNITNYVTVNDVANVLLACGGSPIMSDEPEDVTDITSICSALNINIGTLHKTSIEAMLKAGKKSNELGHPVLLDPVGAGASALRTNTAVKLMKELKLTVDFKEAPGAQLADMIWAIKPESVVVSGDASVLNDMDSIVLDSFDLLSVTTESTSHSYAILVPDGCENLSGVTRATLEIGYPDKTVADVTTHNIRVENASASRNVELLTQELSVRIFGTAAEMEGITGEDVAVVADLSDYAVASGTYMIPAQVRVGDGKTIGVSGTYQVQVRIPES